MIITRKIIQCEIVCFMEVNLDWMLMAKNEKSLINKKLKVNFSNNTYSLFHELSDDEYYTFDKQGVFIFGYILPRLTEKKMGYSPKQILDNYIKYGDDFIISYKGVFTLIVFDGEDVKIFTDRFGISKFFHYNEGGKIFASNRLSSLKNNRNFEVSLENIYMYLIFNYYIKDTTLFSGIKKSEGGMFIRISEKIQLEKYFNIRDFLQDRGEIISEKDTFSRATGLWKDLMGQYLEKFDTKSIAQTLTAGLDSRMILAGFRSNKFNPVTFTFGNTESMDVVYAKEIADKLKIKHNHYCSDKNFFENYGQLASKTIDLGDGLVSLYRAHRLDAYTKLSKKINTVFFGFIGSEITRGGVYPDGLIYPWIIIDKWLGKEINLSTYLEKSFVNIDKKVLAKVKKNIDSYEFMNYLDQYIFEVLIPLHFGQDIRLLERLNIKSTSPFWDIDFLEFLKCTQYFIDNSRKETLSTRGHFKRRKGPFFSTKIVNMMDPENAKISLGKGYSPRDYQTSMYLAGIKFLYYKNVYKKQYSIPNFHYDQWFKNFLLSYMKKVTEFGIININHEECIQAIEGIKGQEELSFVSFVKHINIFLTNELLN